MSGDAPKGCDLAAALLLEVLTGEARQPPSDLSPESAAMLEQSIIDAIAIGGRVNGVDLLHIAAQIIKGELPPSPALSQWIAQGVQRIAAGESADSAFETQRRQGADPLKTAEQDPNIFRRVEDAQARGFRTQPAGGRDSCFEVVGSEIGLDESTVRNRYYKLKSQWEEIENLRFDWPPEQDSK